MKFVSACSILAVAFSGVSCGTSSTTVTGPSFDRCSITVANSVSSIGAAGGAGRLTVTAGRECTWTASSTIPWVTLTSAPGGQGDGVVDYTVAANPAPETRRGSLTIGGQTLEIVQQALACQFDLKPASQDLQPEGGSGTFTVFAPSGCSWTASTSHDWISIASSGGQSGNGTVNFTVAPNPGRIREGAITVGSQVFTVLQSAPSCRAQLTPTSETVNGAGGTGSVTVAMPSACTWTATSGAPWVSVTTGAAGTGNGVVTFSVQPNTGPARSAALTIGGQRFTVSQLQAACNYSIAPGGQTFATGGGQGTVTVSTNSVCTWTTSDVPAWITGMPAGGTGQQAINFTVESNSGPARAADIIIGGQTFAVTQAAGCTYTLAPTGHNAPSSGSSSSIAVNTAAGCAWTSSGAPAWVTGVPANGTGPTTINFTVAANTGVARSANLIIAGQTFAITQAIGCTYSLNPTAHTAPAGGGASSFAVTTVAGCEWTTSGVPAWITGVPGNGNGPATINFTVAANTGPARSANITVNAQTFAVSQTAGCSFSLNPTSHNAPAGGGASSFDITTASGCEWTSSGVPTWITGVPSNGTGSTTINFTVAPNPGAPRSVNITVGGRTFTVNQASACSFSLNPTSHTAAASGGTSSFEIDTDATCEWASSGVPAWITGIPVNDAGPKAITFTVAANTGGPRSANLTVGGQTFTVNQAAGCSYSLNPTSYSAPAAGGASAFVLSTDALCGWSSSGVPAWITGVPMNDTGPATINFTVAANTGPARTANLLVEGQTFTVNQASGCVYVVAPGNLSFDASGLPAKDVTVTTDSGCTWTATPSTDWITIVSGASGNGSGTIRISLAEYRGMGSRSGNIMVGGQTVTITQASP